LVCWLAKKRISPSRNSRWGVKLTENFPDLKKELLRLENLVKNSLPESSAVVVEVGGATPRELLT